MDTTEAMARACEANGCTVERDVLGFRAERGDGLLVVRRLYATYMRFPGRPRLLRVRGDAVFDVLAGARP